MNTPPFESEIQACHACYCRFMDFSIPLSFAVRSQWERWLAEGFKLEDLQVVLKRWSFKVAQGTDAGVMRLSRITDPTTFSEDLLIAHAEKRIRKGAPTPKDRALEQLRPTACEPMSPDAVKSGREAAIRALQACAKNLEQS